MRPEWGNREIVGSKVKRGRMVLRRRVQKREEPEEREGSGVEGEAS